MRTTYNNTNYKFFWNGEFSNWYSSSFTVDGITFNCGEQYMMYMKAMTFNDTLTAQRILTEKYPKVQKQLGREVKGYDDQLWSEIRYETVKRGLREKFTQNPELKSYLLLYSDCTIVEASPYDRIWGIGYLEHEAIEHIDEWGENLLGKILTDLAQELK